MGPTSASINGRLGLPPIRAVLQCVLGLVSIVSAWSSGRHNFVHMNRNSPDAPMALRTRNHASLLNQVCSFLGKDHVKPKRAPSRHGSFIYSRGTQQGPPAKSLSHRSSSDEMADLPCNTDKRWSTLVEPATWPAICQGSRRRSSREYITWAHDLHKWCGYEVSSLIFCNHSICRHYDIGGLIPIDRVASRCIDPFPPVRRLFLGSAHSLSSTSHNAAYAPGQLSQQS